MQRFLIYSISLILMAACAEKPAPAIPELPADAPVVRADQPGYGYERGLMTLAGEPITGYVLELYPDGSVRKKSSVAGGKRNGIEEVWYENGQLKERRYYLHHLKQGEHTGWWPNGNLRFRYQFDLGEYHGEVCNWYSDGAPYSVFHFVQGQEDGPQKLYREDGSLKANYTVREGRRYGLIGTKGCASLWKDDSLPQTMD